MINIDEHLEELEEGFGDDLLKNDQKQSAGTSQPQVKKPEVIKPPSIFTPWLNPQKTEAPKKSRWSSVTSSTARADNIIAAVTGKFYGGLPPPKPLPKAKLPQPTYQQPANMMMPPAGFMPPPMFGIPPVPGMPPLPFPPTSIPNPSIVTPPKLSTIERDRSSRHHSRSPRHRSRSPRNSPRRFSRRSRSRSPRRSYRSRSPPRRSSETSLDGVPVEDSIDEENELFVKLLLKKLQAIRSRRRLESLHVDIMTMVKKAVDEETDTDTKNRRNL